MYIYMYCVCVYVCIYMYVCVCACSIPSSFIVSAIIILRLIADQRFPDYLLADNKVFSCFFEFYPIARFLKGLTSSALQTHCLFDQSYFCCFTIQSTNPPPEWTIASPTVCLRTDLSPLRSSYPLLPKTCKPKGRFCATVRLEADVERFLTVHGSCEER
jgi:hypothetical protein